MTVNHPDIDHTIGVLKDLCDPRGHELLDALGDALKQTIGAVEELDGLFDDLGVSVDGEFARKVGGTREP